jgi:hypothetical protein
LFKAAVLDLHLQSTIVSLLDESGKRFVGDEGGVGHHFTSGTARLSKYEMSGERTSALHASQQRYWHA